VSSYSQIGVSAIFSIYDTGGNFVTESGVGDSPLLDSFVSPVDVTVDFNTVWRCSSRVGRNVGRPDTLGQRRERPPGQPDDRPGEAPARFVTDPGRLFPSSGAFRGMLSHQKQQPDRRHHAAPELHATRLYFAARISFMGRHNSHIPPKGRKRLLRRRQLEDLICLYESAGTSANVTLSLTKSDGTRFR